MGTHTKIVELYGIPASGKTTLSYYLKDNASDGLAVGVKSDLTRESCKSCRYKLLLSVRLRDIRNSLSLYYSIPRSIRRKDISLIHLVKVHVYYRFASLFSNYDVLFVDHGIIQTFISCQNDTDIFSDYTFSKSIVNTINSFENVYYVYCRISPDLALKRMKERNRNSGHIDTGNNDQFKFELLSLESLFCEKYEDVILKSKKSIFSIDTSTTTEIAGKALVNILEEHNIV